MASHEDVKFVFTSSKLYLYGDFTVFTVVSQDRLQQKPQNIYC